MSYYDCLQPEEMLEKYQSIGNKELLTTEEAVVDIVGLNKY